MAADGAVPVALVVPVVPVALVVSAEVRAPSKAFMIRAFAICIVLALVAGGGVSRYRTARQLARIEEVRRTLAAQAARVDLSIRSGIGADFQQINTVLKRVREESKQRIAWVQLRDEKGAVRGHAGIRASATFPLEFVRSQLRNRRPVFAVTQTEAGPVLLEVFAVRLPAESREVRFLTASDEAEQFGVLEIAAHIDGLVAAPEERRRSLVRAARANFL